MIDKIYIPTNSKRRTFQGKTEGEVLLALNEYCAKRHIPVPDDYILTIKSWCYELQLKSEPEEAK